MHATTVLETPQASPAGQAEPVTLALTAMSRHPRDIHLDDLARATDQSRSAIALALAELRHAGLATREFPSGAHSLSDELVRLAFSFLERQAMSARTEPVLRALSTHLGETVHLAVRDGHDIVYRAKAAPLSRALSSAVVGERRPVYCTAAGRVLLAHVARDKHAVAAFMAAGPRPEARTPHTKTSLADLQREVARVRIQGFATEEQETDIDVGCLALPLPGSTADPVRAVISISAPIARTPVRQLVEELPAIRELLAPLAGRSSGPGGPGLDE